MAGTSLLLLLDDIASVLDDVALMTKVAAKKTAGVLGDDLALNANQLAGVRADRELPVVWAVLKGSLKNKLILVPAALAVSWAAPWLVMPLLMVGGAYLCLEGFEKLAHRFLHSRSEDAVHEGELTAALSNPEIDLVAFEQQRIQGAIRTDFVLSAEIIVIALGSVAAAAFATQVAVISAIALIMTFGVYGLVAGIVKLDDLGLYLCRESGTDRRPTWRLIGLALLRGAPYLMKTLSVVGTAAMFMVGGGIVAHGIPALNRGIENLSGNKTAMSFFGGVMDALVYSLVNILVGIVVGAVCLAAARGSAAIYRRLNHRQTACNP